MKRSLAALVFLLVGAAIPEAACAQSASRSLAGPGDAARGRELFADKEVARCVLCHRPPGFQVAGNVGPTLRGVGDRLSAGEIRQRIMDITKVNADAMMPSFYRTEGLTRVAPEYAGKTVLTGQQVEDLVAYLVTLK